MDNITNVECTWEIDLAYEDELVEEIKRVGLWEDIQSVRDAQLMLMGL